MKFSTKNTCVRAKKEDSKFFTKKLKNEIFDKIRASERKKRRIRIFYKKTEK